MTEDYTEQMIRTDLARRIGQEGLEPVPMPEFLTTDDRLIEALKVNLISEDGHIVVDSNNQPVLYIPLENRVLYQTIVYLNSHLSRTSNLTTNEADLLCCHIKRIFLWLEAEVDEETYYGNLWVLYQDIKLHLIIGVKDNIKGWRGKLLTVKEWYAHLSTSGEKSSLRGLFGRK